MDIHRKYICLAMMFGLIYIVVGCSPPAPEATPTITSTKTPKPTVTNTPTPTATATPTAGEIVEGADVLLQKSEYEAALDMYERALTVEPDYEQAHAGIIYAHLWKGLTSSTIKGLEIAQEAAESHPDSAVIQTALAWA